MSWVSIEPCTGKLLNLIQWFSRVFGLDAVETGNEETLAAVKTLKASKRAWLAGWIQQQLNGISLAVTPNGG